MGKKLGQYILMGVLLMGAMPAYADITVVVNAVAKGKPEKSLGTVTFADTKYGLFIMPSLSGLAPGLHGFHIHQNPFCSDNGMGAGGHLDPAATDKHAGPYVDAGHLGDLPALYVDADGKATHAELAPRLKISDIMHHALMIHAGGDNYTDHPPMGGGGSRIACGVIEAPADKQ